MKEKSICFEESCPVSNALLVIGGKWKLQIIWILNKEHLRYGELKRKLSGISEKVLINQLKELTEDGIVKRIQYAEIPPKVEYHLTKTGKSLLPILEQMKDWSIKNLAKNKK